MPKTCHNKKIEVPFASTTTIKTTKLIAKIKTQLAKPIKIPIHYPFIMCFSVEHKYGECPQKIEVQNMFKTKPINYNVTTTPKLPNLTMYQSMW